MSVEGLVVNVALDLISEKAQFASQRYGYFLSSLQALYTVSISNPEFGSAAERNALVREANKLGADFIEREIGFIEDDVDAVFRVAHQTTIDELRSSDTQNVPELASEQLGLTVNYLYDEVRAQVSRDIALLKNRLQIASLEISVSARTKLFSLRQAQMQYRVMQVSAIRFLFRDRAGRNWNSEKFYRQLWRHTLLSAYNETVLIVLADHGVHLAEISHPDPKADVAGMAISLTPGSQYPIYSEIRDTVFHPNANALLKSGLSHVSS